MKQKSIKKVLMLGVAIGCFTLASSLPSSAQSDTLQQSVFRALQDNPDVQVRLKEKRADESRVNEAFSGYLPTLDVQASSGLEYIENSTTRARVDSDSDTLSPTQASFSLRQMIFDGLETPNLVEEARKNSEAASHRLMARAEQISLDVTQSYLEVVRRARVVQLARQNVATHEEYLGMVRERADSGVGSTADVSQAVSRLGIAENVLIQSLRNLRDSVASYERLVGEEPRQLVRPDAPIRDLPVSLNDAVALATANNPAVLAAEKDVEASQAAADATKAAFLPRFDVEIDGSIDDDVGGVEDSDESLAAMFMMRYNLYNGGADTARQRTAVFERSRSQSVLTRTKRLVAEESKFAWHAMIEARDNVTTLESVVRANKQVRDAYLEQFQLGQRDLLDLLDTENELFQSRVDLNNRRFETLFSAYRVLTATGTLLRSLEVTLPSHFTQLAAR